MNNNFTETYNPCYFNTIDGERSPFYRHTDGMFLNKITLSRMAQNIRIDDMIFPDELKFATTSKNVIKFPVSKFFGVPQSDNFDSFIMAPKRCYNSDEVRNHICNYINYFTAFYDPEKEYLFHIFRMKNLIDNGIRINDTIVEKYTLDKFIGDIKKYILSNRLYDKVWSMVQNEYRLNLTYKNKNNEALQYNNTHGMYFMEISIFQNFIIPIMMHFIFMNGIKDSAATDKIILETYNLLFDQYIDPVSMERRGLTMVDMFNKIYETASTSMVRDSIKNPMLWEISMIRGFSPNVNANDSINTIILQLMPKYRFDGNMVMCNIAGVRNNITFNIEVQYEFDFAPMISSKSDNEDGATQLDNFEIFLAKTDEGLVVTNDHICESVMANINSKFGPFSKEEIDFYYKCLSHGGNPIIRPFQKSLLFNIFFKYFGDTRSPNSVNVHDYIILIIAAKRILLSMNMKILPYVISSVHIRSVQKNALSKREYTKIINSEYYNELWIKYNHNEKLLKDIERLIASVLGSSFSIIDYDNPNIHGRLLNIEPDILINEMILYILEI